MNCELTNMCMITDPGGRMLIQHRLPKPTAPWCGLAFPGEHVELSESIFDSVIHEVKEETGLTVSKVESCCNIRWYNQEKQSHYIVFLFKISSFIGDLKSSYEGRMEWTMLDGKRAGETRPNMERYLKVFCSNNVLQAYGVSESTVSAVHSTIFKQG